MAVHAAPSINAVSVLGGYQRISAPRLQSTCGGFGADRDYAERARTVRCSNTFLWSWPTKTRFTNTAGR